MDKRQSSLWASLLLDSVIIVVISHEEQYRENVRHCDDHLSGLTPVMSHTQRVLNACIREHVLSCSYWKWRYGQSLIRAYFSRDDVKDEFCRYLQEPLQ